jgi:hypothetical protein
MNVIQICRWYRRRVKGDQWGRYVKLHREMFQERYTNYRIRSERVAGRRQSLHLSGWVEDGDVYTARWTARDRVQLKPDGTRRRTGREVKGETGELSG